MQASTYKTAPLSVFTILLHFEAWGDWVGQIGQVGHWARDLVGSGRPGIGFHMT